MIGGNDTFDATVVHKTDTLDIKPVVLFVRRPLQGSSLVLKHIPCDVDRWRTRPGRVHGR